VERKTCTSKTPSWPLPDCFSCII